MVRWLGENGADVNACDEDYQTTLHWAAEGGHIDVVRWLVENGPMSTPVMKTTRRLCMGPLSERPYRGGSLAGRKRGRCQRP